jgi:predicted nucleic acid-binding protein
VTRYLLDTSVYIRAWRNPVTDGADLERFHRAHVAATHLSSVVLHELVLGSNNPKMARDLITGLAYPFKRTRRVVVPSHGVWTQAAEVIAQLARHDGLDRSALPRGFVNDVLIAASCRESGLTLITENGRDFSRIRKRMKFEFIAPWPS